MRVVVTISLVLAACSATMGCSSSGASANNQGDASPDVGSGGVTGDAGHVDGEVTSCPPAPFEQEDYGKPCHDPQLGCPYAQPSGYAGIYPSTIGCDLEAMGQCVDGGFQVTATTVMCCPDNPGQVKWCSPSLTEGAPCNEPDNSECVLQDQSATCACDKPGPIWRCLPIDGGVQYCSCQMNGDCPLDAGADAADAGAG